MEEENQFIYLILLLSISVFVILIVVVILVLRNARIQIEKQQEQQFFEEQLLKSRIEISEENMRYIGRELHDNIGQLLSVAGMELKMNQHFLARDSSLVEVSDIISKSILELRHLSKSLNNDALLNEGLQKSIEREISRINRMGLLNAKLDYDSEVSLTSKVELIIFRVLQEFISNTVKHASAKNLTVSIKTLNDQTIVTAQDDGVGFDPQSVIKNSGLINIESRVKMINGDINLTSSPNEGTLLQIKLKSHE